LNKHYISPQQLLEDSFRLAWQVYDSGFRPAYIVGVWRGGTPVGIAVQELMQLLGVAADHCAIKTSSYAGIGQRESRVQVDGLEYLLTRLRSGDSILLVDDVHDTGLSLQHTINELQRTLPSIKMEVRIATPYYKPGNNRRGKAPDYFLHSTDDWLVFPHELDGLTSQELRANKPELASLMPELANWLDHEE
jgi:hypoxanthine phosphoribosyltransferase